MHAIMVIENLYACAIEFDFRYVKIVCLNDTDMVGVASERISYR